MNIRVIPTFAKHPLKDYELRRHDTLEGIIELLYEVPTLEGRTTLPASHGEEEQDLATNLQLRRALGFCGFADTDLRVLHFWLDVEVASFAYALGFFAHELAHLELHPAGEPTLEQREAFEVEADTIAAIAVRALVITRSLTQNPSGEEKQAAPTK